MTRRLNELAGAAPDERRPATDALPVLVAREVVIDRRAEVISTLHPREDVSEEDEVDAIVRVEAKLGEGAIRRALRRQPRTLGRRRERRDVRIPCGVAETELNLQLVLEPAELCLRGHTELADVPTVLAACW